MPCVHVLCHVVLRPPPALRCACWCVVVRRLLWGVGRTPSHGPIGAVVTSPVVGGLEFLTSIDTYDGAIGDFTTKSCFTGELRGRTRQASIELAVGHIDTSTTPVCGGHWAGGFFLKIFINSFCFALPLPPEKGKGKCHMSHRQMEPSARPSQAPPRSPRGCDT